MRDLARAVRDGWARPVNNLKDSLRFRFSDINPLTGYPYAKSKFRDLPEYAAAAVEDQQHLDPAEWDLLVDAGESYDFVGYFDSYVIPDHMLSDEVCPKCESRGTTGPRTGPNITDEQRCPLCRGAGGFRVMTDAAAVPTTRQAEETIFVVAA